MKKPYTLIGMLALLLLATGCSNQSSKEKLQQAEASSLAEESSDTLDKVSDKELFSDDDESTDTAENVSDANAETTESKSSTSAFSTPSVNTSSIQLSGGSSIKISKFQPNQTAKSSTNNLINTSEQAINAAKSKYGNQDGKINWSCMIDGTTGQPIKNADGSYFIKGTSNDGSMTGTQYSLRIYPDGTIKEN